MTLRIASAAVGVPVLAIFVWAGSPAFSVLIAILAGIGAWEACRMAEERGHSPDIPVAITSCFGRSVISSPLRFTFTIHSPAASSKRAF